MRRVGGWLSAIVCLLSLTCSPGFAADPSSVPILLYHRLGPVSPDEMTVTTPVFEAQLKLIQERGYKVIPLAALMAALGDSAAPLPERAVVLTADDGHRTVYSDMFPLIQRLKIPVTLFIYPSAISNADYAMTWAQLAEMKASGLVDIQSHTFWHPNFNVEKQAPGTGGLREVHPGPAPQVQGRARAAPGRQGRPPGLAVRHPRRSARPVGAGGGLCRGVHDRTPSGDAVRQDHGAAALHRHRPRPWQRFVSLLGASK